MGDRRRTLSKDTPTSDGDPGPSIRPNRVKRQRSDSRETNPVATKAPKRIKPGQSKGGRVPNNDRLFACQFCKRAPELWSTIDGCMIWRNMNIATVIRHHVLTTHKALNDDLDNDDPRRIDPDRFAKLKKWKDGIRLEKRKGAGLWATAYSILFDLPKTERDSIPSPYFTAGSAEDAVSLINARLHDRLIDDPPFVEHDVRFALLKTKKRETQREVEKGYVREYYGLQIRQLKGLCDFELRRIEERCDEDISQYFKGVMSELVAPQRSNSDKNVSYTGTSPLLKMNSDIGMGMERTIMSTDPGTNMNIKIPRADVAIAPAPDAQTANFRLSLPPRFRAPMHLGREARGKLPASSSNMAHQSTAYHTRQRSRQSIDDSHGTINDEAVDHLHDFFETVKDSTNGPDFDALMENWTNSPDRGFSP